MKIFYVPGVWPYGIFRCVALLYAIALSHGVLRFPNAAVKYTTEQGNVLNFGSLGSRIFRGVLEWIN